MNKSNKTALLIVCILFGYLGIHRFCTGKVKSGLLYLFTGGIGGIGWIVDIILIATGNFDTPKTSRIVYTTSDSNLYHYDPRCYGMLYTTNMDIKSARASGRKPCNRCCH